MKFKEIREKMSEITKREPTQEQLEELKNTFQFLDIRMIQGYSNLYKKDMPAIAKLAYHIDIWIESNHHVPNSR